MSTQTGVVIVGAGQAGARCASLLRQQGYAGGITLLGAEPHLPYERPPLSKEALTASVQDIAAHVPPVFPAEYYTEHDIDLRTAVTVAALDIAGKNVLLQDGGTLAYDTLVLATGSRPRPYQRNDVRESALLTLRTLEDTLRLRKQLHPGRRLMLIGGGFIGLEIAAAAAAVGCSVTVVELQDRILKRSLSSTAAAILTGLHESQGVKFKTGAQISNLRQREAGFDYVLDDGTRGHADLAVLGIGGIPNAELGAEAGLKRCLGTGGILVDTWCRTSSPDVYAIGDVACEFNSHYGVHTRLESWDNAEAQAMRAAIDISGSNENTVGGLPPTNMVPWFWTDQYDLNLQIVGLTHGAERHIERRGIGNKRVLFHFHDTRLLGAELFNSGRERRVVRQLIALSKPVDEKALADGAIPLNQLLVRAQEPDTATR